MKFVKAHFGSQLSSMVMLHYGMFIKEGFGDIGFSYVHYIPCGFFPEINKGLSWLTMFIGAYGGM